MHDAPELIPPIRVAAKTRVGGAIKMLMSIALCNNSPCVVQSIHRQDNLLTTTTNFNIELSRDMKKSRDGVMEFVT
eukprot:scaffold8678_cov87-Skeletonema_dohrnii-CCMP3373.AAC.1